VNLESKEAGLQSILSLALIQQWNRTKIEEYEWNKGQATTQADLGIQPANPKV